MRHHNFSEKLASGLRYEAILDQFFHQYYSKIETVYGQAQLQGYDRVFHRDERNFKVEYKADTLAEKTGNAFIELMHCTEDGAQCWGGWIVGSQARYLALYLPTGKVCLWLSVQTLRANLFEWNERCSKGSLFNKGKKNQPFYTQGIKVPLAEIESLAIRTYRL